MEHNVLGIEIPDSKIARDVTELIRDTESELLFHHSMRVYFWAALKGKHQRLKFDPELLYTASMFHDIGLTEGYGNSQLRFEVDSANAARDFLRSRAIAETDLEKVWLAIALHTTPGIPEHMSPEIALLQAGTAMDVVGHGFGDFSDHERQAVISAYPREHAFKHEIIDAFYDGMRHRPDSTFGTFNDDILSFKDPSFKRADLCTIILGSRWQ